MRRLALTLIASLSIAVLTGCAGYGGSAFGGGQSSSFDRLVFSTGGTTQGIFKVAPVATAAITPLYVSVYGGKSQLNVTQFDTTATWQAGYAPGAVYQNGSSGTPGQTSVCPALPAAGPPGAFANPNPSTTTPVAGTVTQPGGALVVNSAVPPGFATYSPGAFSQTIGIVPVQPQVVTTPAGATVTLNPPPAPYCLNIVATAQNGVVGNFIVLVSN